MTTDTTHTENAHVAAIRRALEHERRHGGSLALDQIEKHAEALARELADAEARAEFDCAELQAVTDEHRRTKAALAAERARVGRLRSAFLRAEARVEMWEANQDQTVASWLARWGLEPGDLDETAPARADGGA